MILPIILSLRVFIFRHFSTAFVIIIWALVIPLYHCPPWSFFFSRKRKGCVVKNCFISNVKKCVGLCRFFFLYGIGKQYRPFFIDRFFLLSTVLRLCRKVRPVVSETRTFLGPKLEHFFFRDRSPRKNCYASNNNLKNLPRSFVVHA